MIKNIRTPLSLLLAMIMVPLVADPAAASPAGGDARSGVWAVRTAAAYRALQDQLFLGADDHGLYAESKPAGDNRYSFLWEFREATQATLEAAGVPQTHAADEVSDRFTALQHYRSDDQQRPGYESYPPPPLGQGGDLFYDDNAVVGLTYLDAYRSGMIKDLDGARAAFETVLRGWDTDPQKKAPEPVEGAKPAKVPEPVEGPEPAKVPEPVEGPQHRTEKTCPGGMRWVEADWNEVRAANVTGLFAQLAANLYEETGEQRYHDWSVKAYDWNRRCLMQSPGLYNNDRNDDGTVNQTLWTYNSGAMIGTAVALYRATGNEQWLHRADADADGAMAYWTAEDRLYQQPAIFNAFLFSDLAELDAITPDPSYRATLADYADRLWRSNREPDTGLYRFQPSNGGAPDPEQPFQTLNQAAVVQLFAQLARRS